MVIGRKRRALSAAFLLLVVILAGGVAVAWHPAIGRIDPGSASFPPDLVARGATLAAVGDCAVCHTTSGGAPFAGGRALPTPFGTVYVANITPDPDTGIGRWPEAAFRRAMREGIDRRGHHLYPALPYPHFTRATDADIAALYAFLMTRAPVRATRPANALHFPLNFRPMVAGWNLLFLSAGPWQPDPAHDAEWNRGAYLVEAVGHCGACHTPHNALGAEEANQLYAGGEAEGWDAPSLASAARPWSVEDLQHYLRTGLSAAHGVAGGPMTAVTAELAQVPEADVHAIAVYLRSRMPPPQLIPAPMTRRDTGNAVFGGACGGCHGADAPMIQSGAPPLAVTAAVNAPNPSSAIRVILHGIPWREGHAGAYMPPFAATLSDQQIAQLVGFLRTQYSNRPAWTGIDGAVQSARREAAGQEGDTP